MKFLWYVVLVVLSIINVALFVFWFSLIKIEAPNIYKMPSYAVDSISLQIAILEAAFAVVGISLAVIGFFGFQTIRESAINSAKKIAKEVAEVTAKEEAKNLTTKFLNEEPLAFGNTNLISKPFDGSINDIIEDDNLQTEERSV